MVKLKTIVLHQEISKIIVLKAKIILTITERQLIMTSTHSADWESTELLGS